MELFPSPLLTASNCPNLAGTQFQRLPKLEQSASELSSATGQKCSYAAADVRDKEALKQAVEKCIREFGRIDFVICGALFTSLRLGPTPFLLLYPLYFPLHGHQAERRSFNSYSPALLTDMTVQARRAISSPPSPMSLRTHFAPSSKSILLGHTIPSKLLSPS